MEEPNKAGFCRSNIPAIFLFLLIISGLLASCRKPSGEPPPPVPVWEDNSADSASLSVTVKTSLGILVAGQYVNLALSSDSLKNQVLVREPGYTNAAGIASFRKLYPRKIFFDCKVITATQVYYGTATINLVPGGNKDTVLIVN